MIRKVDAGLSEKVHAPPLRSSGMPILTKVIQLQTAVLRLRTEEARMLKFICAALIAVSLICCGRADAQNAPDPEIIAAAKELVTTLRTADRFKQIVPTIVQSMKPAILAGRPQMEKDFDSFTAAMLEGVNARVDELLDQIAGVYGRNFTASELREITAF
jgi:hypothetical protein